MTKLLPVFLVERLDSDWTACAFGERDAHQTHQELYSALFRLLKVSTEYTRQNKFSLVSW